MKHKSLVVAVAVGGAFFVLIGSILVMLGKEIITPQMAMLMFVALLGLYVGFGVLIAVYRFMNKLQ